MEKTCGDCAWLEKDEGKPYYCAWHDLYDFHEENDAACEDWGYREQQDEAGQNETKKIDGETQK